MKNIFLIGLLFSHVSLVAADADSDDEILKEVEDDEQQTDELRDDEQTPVPPPQSYCNIEAHVSYLLSLQNRSGLKEDELAHIIHHAYSQYRCSPTFKRLGGMTALNSLAEQYKIRLKFNPKKIPQTLLQACSDKAVVYPVIIVVGLGTGVVLLINYSHEAMVKASVVVLKNATQLATGWCDLCLQHWRHDAFTEGYRLYLYNQIARNCSELVDLVGQNISDIAESCSEGLHQWVGLENKSFFYPICYGRGQVIGFERCQLDDVRKHLQADATNGYINDHIFGIMASGFTATCSFIGGCCVYGGAVVHGAQRKLSQCANNIKRAFNRCRGSLRNDEISPETTSIKSEVLLNEDE